jgi:hypothetical protein
MSCDELVLGGAFECQGGEPQFLSLCNQPLLLERGAKPPPRPPNAFILFSRIARPSIQHKYPGLNNIAYTRILALTWKMIPDDQKLTFKRQAAEMQKEFKLRNPNYTYKRTSRLSKSDRLEPSDLSPPVQFRWDQMLNHHEDSN